MEYTRRKPSPDLTYCSLMALERIGGVFSSRFHALDDLNAHIFLLTSSVEYVEESNFLVDHALLAIEICEDKRCQYLDDVKNGCVYPRWLDRTRRRNDFE